MNGNTNRRLDDVDVHTWMFSLLMSYSHWECACVNVKVNANRCVDNCRGVCMSGCVRIKVNVEDAFFCKCPTHMGGMCMRKCKVNAIGGSGTRFFSVPRRGESV